MRLLTASFFALTYFQFSSGSSSFHQQRKEDFLEVNTPHKYGMYLHDRLHTNESRFISKVCLQYMKEYYKSLLSGKFWALKMFDANAKFPSGFFRVNGGSLGSFDECINIKTENERLGTIRGKYCLGVLQLLDMKKERIMDFDLPNATNSEAEERMLDLAKLTFSLPWGICLPDACSANDIRILHLYILRIPEENCQTKSTQTKNFDSADIAAIILFGVIGGLMAGSTVYDVIICYRGKEPGSVLLRSFSIIANSSRILRCRENDVDITCIHGMRAVNLMFFIIGLRYFIHIFAPLNNWIDMAKWLLNMSAMLEANVILDTFFVITGTLVSYKYLMWRTSGVKFNLITYYLGRIIRLTPALAAVVLVHSTVLRHIGSGPVWLHTRDSLLVDNCKNHWWQALLYVQNYVNPRLPKLCVLQSWQLNVDMQLFLLSPLILIPLTRWPKYTLSAVGFLIFSGLVASFLTAWIYELKSVIITFRSITDIGKYIRYFCFPTHIRASSWLIGFVLGYLIFETKKTKRKPSFSRGLLAVIVIFLWLISFVIIVMCVQIGGEVSGKQYNWLVHAFHMTLVKPLWCLAISWIIFACVNGYGGPINTFLSAPIFQVISRISYGTYLVNLTLMFILTFQTRVGLEFSNQESLYKSCGDIVLCLLLGFLWTIAFESPFITIWNVVSGKFSKLEKKDQAHQQREDCILHEH